MIYETIRLEEARSVARVVLDRPDNLNAMNTQMRAELTHAVKHASANARVIVITGAGRAFCSGQDLGDGATSGRINLERTLRDEYQPLIEAIIDSPVPVVAAVNGAAAGAGANLALAADVVIAKESAYFMQAFSRIGLVPDAGGTYVLPRQVGMARAMGMALFADKVSALQAAEWGLIWEAVPDAGFDAHIAERATYLAEGPTEAFREMKRLIRGSWSKEPSEQMGLEAKAQSVCGRSRDFQEGVLAFSEKRPPKFEGR